MSRQSKSYEGYKAIVKQAVAITKVELLSEGNELSVSYDLVRMARSRLNEPIIVEHSLTKIIQKDHLVLKDYSHDFINVEMSMDVKSSLSDSIFTKPVYLVVNNGRIKTYIHLGKSIKCLNDGTESLLPPVDAMVYKYSEHSPSGIKKFSAIFQRVDIKDTRYDNLNNGSNGALEMLRLRCLSAQTVNEIDKIISGNYVRFGCIRTASINVGQIKMMIIDEEWTDTSSEPDESLLSENNLKNIVQNYYAGKTITDISRESIKFKPFDGMSFIDGLVYAQLLSQATGKDYTENDVVGCALQTRPGTCKVLTIVISHNAFMLLVKQQKAQGKKYHVAGSNGPICMITDLNGEKMPFDYSLPLSLEILAVSKKSYAKLSTQIVDSVLSCGAMNGVDMSAVIEELCNIEIASKYERFYGDVNKPQKIVTPKELETALKTGYVDSIIDSRCPDAIYSFRALYNNYCSQVTNGAVKLATKLNPEVKGCNVRIIADPVSLFTAGKVKGILKYGQAFVNAKLSGGVAFKHPKNDAQEFYAFSNVTLKAVKRAIDELPVSESVKTILYDFYSSLDSSVMVLPVSIIAPLKCAGYDYDWDGMTLLIYTKTTKRALTEKERLTNEIIKVLIETKERANIILR